MRTVGLLWILNYWSYENSPLCCFIFFLFLTQIDLVKQFVMWSYTGCHLQNRAVHENRSEQAVKGGQEPSQSKTAFSVWHGNHPKSFVPDKFLHVDILMLFKLHCMCWHLKLWGGLLWWKAIQGWRERLASSLLVESCVICDGRSKLKSYDFADVELFSVLRVVTSALSSVLRFFRLIF